MAAEPTAQLAALLDVTAQLAGGVRAGQWSDPTPCSEWCVSDLLRHLVTGNNLFTAALGGQPPAGRGDHQPGSELVQAYRDSASALLDAFRQPGVLEKVVTVPFGQVPGIVALHLRLTELLAHGWDLARATGQPAAFPQDVAAQEIAFCQGTLSKVPPGRTPFAPPRPAAPGAPAIDRLAALLGRDVTAAGAAGGAA